MFTSLLHKAEMKCWNVLSGCGDVSVSMWRCASQWQAQTEVFIPAITWTAM